MAHPYFEPVRAAATRGGQQASRSWRVCIDTQELLHFRHLNPHAWLLQVDLVLSGPIEQIKGLESRSNVYTWDGRAVLQFFPPSFWFLPFLFPFLYLFSTLPFSCLSVVISCYTGQGALCWCGNEGTNPNHDRGLYWRLQLSVYSLTRTWSPKSYLLFWSFSIWE